MRNINITNAHKVLWPKLGITKKDYINLLYQLSPYLIKHAKNRRLTIIRYPEGVGRKSFYQKNLPDYAPEWVEQALNNIDILMWMGNQAALEFHITFNNIARPDYPDSLVFDLDPSEGQSFDQVVEVALLINETLLKLHINSYPKTSGASGMQIYIPVGGKYTYHDARKLNAFFGQYFSQSYQDKITIERFIKNRNKKLYFDYLQMWKGKTIIAPYSPRAVENALISTPVTWEELKKGIDINDYNIFTIMKRINEIGDLYDNLDKDVQDLSFLLENIKKMSQ